MLFNSSLLNKSIVLLVVLVYRSRCRKHANRLKTVAVVVALMAIGSLPAQVRCLVVSVFVVIATVIRSLNLNYVSVWCGWRSTKTLRIVSVTVTSGS